MSDDSLAPDVQAIPTSTAHTEVQEALQLLTLVLADPDGSAVDAELASDVADVVSDLLDVRPLLPPLRYPTVGADDDQHALALMAHAARRLQTAVTASPDNREKLRAGLAVRRLRALIQRWQP